MLAWRGGILVGTTSSLCFTNLAHRYFADTVERARDSSVPKPPDLFWRQSRDPIHGHVIGSRIGHEGTLLNVATRSSEPLA